VSAAVSAFSVRMFRGRAVDEDVVVEIFHVLEDALESVFALFHVNKLDFCAGKLCVRRQKRQPFDRCILLDCLYAAFAENQIVEREGQGVLVNAEAAGCVSLRVGINC